ncbi:PAS domain-containing protein [Bermanella sp. WJH001]|uniref:PAS domain-containing protein n=1 Tax=Bermanella sp. WJH001 TaxID=3048005 RepID=UPI0024BE0F22|nr:PAS domain-containing protein [Bermanella sp. WJH001]MDJ1537623.1 PAS domain-containing protein [Bermanella sp. WJH001]
MSNNDTDMTEFHWFMDILQTIDAGLVVLDRDYNIKLWNGFMENHSGIRPDQAKGNNLFELFTEIDKEWFKKKAESVFLLNTRAFTISEQRPYLFKFKNNHPITGRAEFMYQNSTMIPLNNIEGTTDHICLIIYDVTAAAMHKNDLANK